jgi:RNA polymerase sigma factor (sigma-70 family)
LEEEKAIILNCQKGDLKAFERLYHQFAAKMLVVCTRYAYDKDEAKDLLQEGFIRVFEKIKDFRAEGSLEGWIRKVIVSVALANFNKNVKVRNLTLHESEQNFEQNQPLIEEDITTNIAFNDLLLMIQDLPPAYRMVFNLYVFEGYKHHEIAKELKINEGTSKSNLFQAKRILQIRIKKELYSIGN